MHNGKVFLQKFFALYGIFFVGAYIASFFLIITFFGSSADEVLVFGDIRFSVAGSQVYLPFVSAAASAIFITLIFQVYRFLKG